MTKTHDSLALLSDDDLLSEVKHLASVERRATAALVRLLMELDSRRLYLREGCSSLFTWCTEVLRLEEGAAYNRIEVARVSRRFPVILDMLEEGSLTLTAARLLAPHLTPENHDSLLASARHRRKRDVERLIAALRPQPDAPVVIRRLPASRPGEPATTGAAADAPPVDTPGRDQDQPIAASGKPAVGAPADGRVLSELDGRTRHANRPGITGTRPAVLKVTPADSRGPRTVEQPLAPGRVRLQLTISETTHEKLRRARDLCRHSNPAGDLDAVLDRALTLLIEEIERRRFGATRRPRAVRASGNGSRHIPAAVRRAVWKRDGGQCAFVGTQGRCTERAFLEFHHVHPHGAGGVATIDNIELRCRAHNAYEASLYFGVDGADVVREAGVAYLTS